MSLSPSMAVTILVMMLAFGTESAQAAAFVDLMSREQTLAPEALSQRAETITANASGNATDVPDAAGGTMVAEARIAVPEWAQTLDVVAVGNIEHWNAGVTIDRVFTHVRIDGDDGPHITHDVLEGRYGASSASHSHAWAEDPPSEVTVQLRSNVQFAGANEAFGYVTVFAVARGSGGEPLAESTGDEGDTPGQSGTPEQSDAPAEAEGDAGP